MIHTPLTSTDQLRIIADRFGSPYFSPAMLRFFSSRIHRPIYGGRFFVTSERDEMTDYARTYSVRSFDVDEISGRINFDTVGDFGQYATRSEAHAAARTAARFTR